MLSESQSAGNKYLSPASLTIEKAISNIRKDLRTGQQSMINWEHGPLAVSAVPGAGKSTGMAAAVAIAIASAFGVANAMAIETVMTIAAAMNSMKTTGLLPKTNDHRIIS